MFFKLESKQSKLLKILSAAGLIALGTAVGIALTVPRGHLLANFEELSPEEQHEQMVAMRNVMHQGMLPHGDFACCLTKPCASCLTLDPWHGEGGTCTCLEDIMNGEPPCGECVGGILAGRGNRFIAKHFARSLADSQEGEYYEVLKKIIAEKYNVPVEKQK